PGSATLTGVDEPDELPSCRVAANLFPMMGVAPQLGRGFSADEEDPGKNGVVILSDGLWKRKFGGTIEVMGKTIQLDAQTYRVVGVMPAGFQFPAKGTQLWVPLSLTPATKANRGGFWMYLIGRLRPGARVEQAQVELSTESQRLEREYPFMRGY